MTISDYNLCCGAKLLVSKRKSGLLTAFLYRALFTNFDNLTAISKPKFQQIDRSDDICWFAQGTFPNSGDPPTFP